MWLLVAVSGLLGCQGFRRVDDEQDLEKFHAKLDLPQTQASISHSIMVGGAPLLVVTSSETHFSKKPGSRPTQFLKTVSIRCEARINKTVNGQKEKPHQHYFQHD